MKSVKRANAFIALAVAFAPFGSAAVAANDQPSGPQGQTWAEIAKLPDFTTGIWETPIREFFVQLPDAKLSPPYEKKLQAYNALRESGQLEDTPATQCVPPGMLGIMRQPFPLQILYSPGQVVIVLEAYQQVRFIYTDGRGHPEDEEPGYNGSSIGHWEDGTLVVETVQVSTDTPLGVLAPAGPNYGYEHSDKIKITERFKLTDPDTLVYDTIVEDSEALLEPWVTSRPFKRHADWTISEYICQQNNRNHLDEDGKAVVDVTPPDDLLDDGQ